MRFHAWINHCLSITDYSPYILDTISHFPFRINIHISYFISLLPYASIDWMWSDWILNGQRSTLNSNPCAPKTFIFIDFICRLNVAFCIVLYHLQWFLNFVPRKQKPKLKVPIRNCLILKLFDHYYLLDIFPKKNKKKNKCSSAFWQIIAFISVLLIQNSTPSLSFIQLKSIISLPYCLPLHFKTNIEVKTARTTSLFVQSSKTNAIQSLHWHQTKRNKKKKEEE